MTSNSSNRNRLLRDAKLFDARLKHIDGAGNTGTYLTQLVEGKAVAQPEPESKTPEESTDKAAPEEKTDAPPSESG